MIRISQLVVLGDSLSDRGTLDRRKLLGLLPMSYVTGLSGRAPRGRFTNGYLWADYLCTTVLEDFAIEFERKRLKLKHDARANADIGDEFLTSTIRRRKNETAFNLDDDTHILFDKRRFARFYCEGGLTSHDYSYNLSLDPGVEAYRLILATLEKKRTELLEDDKKYHVTSLEKAETLVMEWSGANDLLTVNESPTYQAVDNAIKERINNIEQLIQNGYRNFVLFNLPNLSLTPRFQAKTQDERDNAAECCVYFNKQLAARCEELNKKYKDSSTPLNLSVFDVHSHFEEVYKNPEQYGFKKDKLKKPYTDSEEFEKNKINPEFVAGKISPAEGYMFWDDVHPTMLMHQAIVERFKERYGTVYNFVPPQYPRTLSVQDDFALQQKIQNFSEDNVSLESGVTLPEDVKAILDTLHQNAKSMCESSYPNYREKGVLLKRFLFELQCQKGDLEKLYEVISTFHMEKTNVGTLRTHYRPVYDFFALKTTTRSEDLMVTLASTIKSHIAFAQSPVSSPVSS
ncbi:SGNH/GDSL hydrolase family protein [Legionella maioricensis]|uniref:SGNH/GDSL hydrolase family protein n=1 Tax=Legionella maioricensis TaxID=2896528 RepID=A0A9X2D030_9GAMM|nr:SGNH/GDSL hydrolase family protein [Legionella maioricensis]MCL9683610.1 SGNH/GDSL hydrolase family protein [Legionella maioricensis]MCL9687632.1 SGNH/GDSL hydrolase family protein [Legionella maioricensis]